MSDETGKVQVQVAPSIKMNDFPDLPFLQARNEMAERIRGFDWSKTPLGPVEKWSPALRMMTNVMLANRFPMLLWWGDQFIQIYNDFYISILGEKHPHAALGKPFRECWSEVFHLLGPLAQTPFDGGPATFVDDILCEVNRYGFIEETHFTFAYSPVPDNTVPSGIGGVLATVQEISEKVISERRTKALRDLGAGVLEQKTAGEACVKATDVLANYSKDIPFALLYLLDSDRNLAHLASSAGADRNESIAPPVIKLDDESAGWPLSAVLQTGEILVVEDLRRKFERVPAGPWSDPPNRATVVPIHSAVARHPVGFMMTGLSPRLRFDDTYRGFLELAASQIAAAITNAQAYEEERKRAEALAEIDRAKTIFFSNVSHEFRTPLTLMLGPLQDLLTRSQTHLTPTAKEQLELVHRNGNRLMRLVNTLLDFSRIEAGRVQAVYEATDLSRFTADLASSFRSATERAGLDLRVDCRELHEPVYIDRDMWEKILLNLLSNAFKFTFEGEIAVSLDRVGEHAELRVRDTGVGISPEALPRVFDRFYRIPNTRSRTYEGSGIGLALVQELVRLHGGSIRVESEVDRGTSFIVDVPFGQNHLPRERIAASRSLSSTSLGATPFVEEVLRWLPDSKPDTASELPSPYELLPVPSLPFSRPETAIRPRIVVVDDNADMRQYLVRLLSEHYEAEAFQDGQAALEAIIRRSPDLVLTDVMMPALDGFGLLNALRNNEATRALPVILLSARAGEESRIEGMQAGADDYLVKPFSARELLARIGARLEIARLQRQSHKMLESQVRDRTRDLQERTAEIAAQSEQLRELSLRLLRTQDDERRRISRELHDSAGQYLAAISMALDAIKGEIKDRPAILTRKLEEACEATQTCISEIRTLSHLLHPPLLDELGLESASRWYAEGFAVRSGIDVRIEIPEELPRLDNDIEMLLFRVIQESLTNVHRHSGSKTATVRIGADSEQVWLEVQDQGNGGTTLNTAGSAQPFRAGIGITGMKERARDVGGTLEVTANPSGTKVKVLIPLTAKDVRSRAGKASAAAAPD